MSKPKPKITKGLEGWMVEKPAYGFANAKPDGPYPTHAAALGSLTIGTGAAGASVERASTPEPGAWASFNSHRVWPGVIR
jgi:hypothetical protein